MAPPQTFSSLRLDSLTPNTSASSLPHSAPKTLLRVHTLTSLLDGGGELSTAQRIWIEVEEERGAVVVVADSLDGFRKWYGETYG